MSNIIDLSTLVKEDLIFKMPNGDEFVIPGQISLDFVLELEKKQNRLNSVKTVESQIKIMKEIVLSILELDTSKDIDMEYVSEHVSDVTIMKVIIESMISHISNIINDENL